MPMSLSADGRYYHGLSSTSGYLFVEVAIAHQRYQQWAELQPIAPDTLTINRDILQAPTPFWTDIALLPGASTLHAYIRVETPTPPEYHVQCLDHGRLIWEYPVAQTQLHRWLTPLTCLIQTSDDPLCGIYLLPQKAIAPLWDINAQEEGKNTGEPHSSSG